MSEYYVTLGNRTGVQLGKICRICNDVFNIYDIDDPRMICPECFRRLKKLLYPEETTND